MPRQPKPQFASIDTTTAKTTNAKTRSEAETNECNTSTAEDSRNEQNQAPARAKKIVAASEDLNLFVQLYEQSKKNTVNSLDDDDEANSVLSNAIRRQEDEENYDADLSSSSSSSCSSSCSASTKRSVKRSRRLSSLIVKRDNFDLRPKFAILKHRPEFIQQKDDRSEYRQQRALASTPAWFFNIPNTRSPFPERFGNQQPASADDDDEPIDVCD